MQALHWARERLVTERTALINQMRALLLERGIVPPQRWRSLAAWIDAPLAADQSDPISPRMRRLVVDMRAEWVELDRRIWPADSQNRSLMAGGSRRSQNHTASRRHKKFNGS